MEDKRAEDTRCRYSFVICSLHQPLSIIEVEFITFWRDLPHPASCFPNLTCRFLLNFVDQCLHPRIYNFVSTLNITQTHHRPGFASTAIMSSDPVQSSSSPPQLYLENSSKTNASLDGASMSGLATATIAPETATIQAANNRPKPKLTRAPYRTPVGFDTTKDLRNDLKDFGFSAARVRELVNQPQREVDGQGQVPRRPVGVGLAVLDGDAGNGTDDGGVREGGRGERVKAKAKGKGYEHLVLREGASKFLSLKSFAMLLKGAR